MAKAKTTKKATKVAKKVEAETTKIKDNQFLTSRLHLIPLRMVQLFLISVVNYQTSLTLYKTIK